jgi:hypothetical protein
MSVNNVCQTVGCRDDAADGGVNNSDGRMPATKLFLPLFVFSSLPIFGSRIILRALMVAQLL